MSGQRILMFHGTSDVFLPRILEDGLVPNPPARLSELMAKGTGHTVSFPGTYFSASLSTAKEYADEAVARFGGSPVLVAGSVKVDDLVPDEDEILYLLEGNIAWVLGYDEEEWWDEDAAKEKKLDPWSRAAAVELARGLAEKAPDSAVDVEAIADRIDALIAPVAGPDWDRSLDLFHPDYNTDGWSSPEWARKLTSTPEGMAGYRADMDALARLLAGMDPYSYSCEIESCKGRVVNGIRADGADEGNFIFAIGVPGDVACHFDRRDRVSGSEIRFEECGPDCSDGYLPEAALQEGPRS